MKLELIVLFIIAQSYFGNLTAANFSMDDINCSGDEVSLLSVQNMEFFGDSSLHESHSNRSSL